MKKVLFFLFLSSALISCGRDRFSHPDLNRMKKQSHSFEKIIGGELVQNENSSRYDGVVALVELNSQMKLTLGCSAVIVGPEYALTAGHCLLKLNKSKSLDRYRLFWGNNIHQPDQGVLASIIDFQFHPQLKLVTREAYDIGYIHFKLETPLTYPLYRIPTHQQLEEWEREKKTVLVMGYGVEDLGRILGYKNQVQFNFEKVDSHEVILLGDGTTATARGDSGGPAIIQNEGNEYLLGIVSRRLYEDSHKWNQGSVITLLNYFMDWISIEVHSDLFI